MDCRADEDLRRVMENCIFMVDVEVYEPHGEGQWAQARYLVHGKDDVLWTDDIEAVFNYLREDLEDERKES